MYESKNVLHTEEEIDHMYELKNVLQREEGIKVRWFVNNYFDLIVWFREENSELYGFQLCYDKSYNERALTWLAKNNRFEHNGVQSRFSINGSPIIVGDDDYEKNTVLLKFKTESKHIDREIRNLVIAKIEEYNTF